MPLNENGTNDQRLPPVETFQSPPHSALIGMA